MYIFPVLGSNQFPLVYNSMVRTVRDWGYYLETDPDPVAMVIRIELFTHKLSDTNTYWHYVTGVFYLQGLWMNSSTLITIVTGYGTVSR